MNLRSKFATALATSLLVMSCQSDNPVEESQFGQTAMPAAACFRTCETAAREAYFACGRSGGDDQRCRPIFNETLEACVRNRCSGATQPPENQACFRTCETAAREAYFACGRSGGNDQRCRPVFNETLEACVRSRCSGATQPPENPTCEQGCARRAAQVREQCERAGGDARACENRASLVTRECESGCR
jgi:hypothetical protein